MVLALIAALIAYRALGTVTISWDMVNVNSGRLQGDAHVLRVGDKTVLIDAGYYEPAKAELAPFLLKNGIKQIDYFFITHPHRDHYEGAIAVIEAGIPIRTMFFKEPARDVVDCCYSRSHLVWFVAKMIKMGTITKKPETGFELDLPHASKLILLHAQEGNLPKAKVDVNDLSMVMKWSVLGKEVLFTGDLNHTVGDFLSTDARMKADILKVPHHGGRSLVPNTFYDRVNPKAALVPGPEWVWCGERGTQTRDWVEQARVPTWINGVDGHVQTVFSLFDVTFSPSQPENTCWSDVAEQPIFQSFRSVLSFGLIRDLLLALKNKLKAFIY